MGDSDQKSTGYSLTVPEGRNDDVFILLSLWHYSYIRPALP